ncbi:putative nuclease HARBI1 [Xyrauchen texanus]|uniref:putative nuclease HARBI1 n=1 Tax=Xyrauchen texanus TaxID=154827 RepID=UPI00224288B2|nr:putative nuclease HARBI1 [Xyrauchen texanus]
MAALQRFLQLEHRRRLRSQSVYINAHIRTNFTPLDSLSDDAILRKFRLPRTKILELFQIVKPHLQRATRRNYALSPEVQLLATLRYFAVGSFMEVVGDSLGLSKSSVSKTVTTVTPLLLQLMKSILVFPKTPEEIQLANQQFYDIDNIPRVIGIIDGTLIPVLSPKVNEHLYICRKGYPAINVQVVCDHQGMFTDIVAKWPGSTHDSFAWANSAICQMAEEGGFGDSWLLGDSGYPLRPYLLTPVQHPATIAEERFNQAHGRTRSIVERTIGLWKQRFSCISKSSGGLKLNPTKSCSVIVVTAILHNIAVRENVQLPEEEVGAVGADGEEDAVSDDDDDPLNPHQGRMHPAGAEVRELLIQNMFGW